MKPKDRDFLDKNFERFGSSWSGGLAKLEKDFTLDVKSRWGKYVIDATLRGPERVRFTITVTKKHGAMSWVREEFPKGPPVDEARIPDEELWLLEPLNQVIQVRPLSSFGKPIHSCVVDDIGVLYFVDGGAFQDLFCVTVDLATNALLGARWIDMPMPGGRLLDDATVDFLDEAFKKNGSFGVYGSVTQGLRALARIENFELQLHGGDPTWRFSLTPKDGHGHFLHFDIDAKSGKIENCVAGHLALPPHGHS